MWTIAPPGRITAAAFVVNTAAEATFTSSTRCHIARSLAMRSSSKLALAADHPVETAEAIDRGRDEPVEVGITRDIGLDEPRSRTQPFRDGRAVLGVAIGEDHGAATFDQGAADGLADERGRPGDDDDAAVELAHDAPRRRRAGAAWRPPRPPGRP